MPILSHATPNACTPTSKRYYVASDGRISQEYYVETPGNAAYQFFRGQSQTWPRGDERRITVRAYNDDDSLGPIIYGRTFSEGE